MKSSPGTDMRVRDANGADEHGEIAELVGSLITMMNAGNVAKLDLEYGELRLSLRSHRVQSAGLPLAARALASADDSAEAPNPLTDRAESHVIKAPMIGTFYTSPAPNEPPFVLPGDHVEEGQTIGIIEAMKIMNEIASDLGGTVVEVIAKNGQPVEFGSALVRLDPSTT